MNELSAIRQDVFGSLWQVSSEQVDLYAELLSPDDAVVSRSFLAQFGAGEIFHGGPPVTRDGLRLRCVAVRRGGADYSHLADRDLASLPLDALDRWIKTLGRIAARAAGESADIDAALAGSVEEAQLALFAILAEALSQRDRRDTERLHDKARRDRAMTADVLSAMANVLEAEKGV